MCEEHRHNVCLMCVCVLHVCMYVCLYLLISILFSFNFCLFFDRNKQTKRNIIILNACEYSVAFHPKKCIEGRGFLVCFAYLCAFACVCLSIYFGHKVQLSRRKFKYVLPGYFNKYFWENRNLFILFILHYEEKENPLMLQYQDSLFQGIQSQFELVGKCIGNMSSQL